MLTTMIPRKHQIGETVDARINGATAKVTWADANTLVINDTDRRRILMTDETIDGAGAPVWFIAAGDSEAAIASGEADTVSIVTPDGVRQFRQR